MEDKAIYRRTLSVSDFRMFELRSEEVYVLTFALLGSLLR